MVKLTGQTTHFNPVTVFVCFIIDLIWSVNRFNGPKHSAPCETLDWFFFLILKL